MNEVGQWEGLYGDFEFNRDFHNLDITNLEKESGWIRGEIVHAVQQVPSYKGKVLLPGEPGTLKKAYSEMLGIEQARILTAGLGKEVDYPWNFEKEPPFKGKFSLIISQAMLEHLIDPFRHIKDLMGLLEPGGHLIVHTVMPGFPYHRYPIDCMRFYPDWFEAVADRLRARVIWKYIGELRILYLYRQENVARRPWWKLLFHMSSYAF